MASLAADQLIFNSKWNLDSFLENMNSHLKIIPDFRHDIEKSDILLGQLEGPPCNLLRWYFDNFNLCQKRPKNLEEKIRQKSIVTYFPISRWNFNEESNRPKSGPVHIVWAHRWEHDKNPKLLFSVLRSVQVLVCVRWPNFGLVHRWPFTSLTRSVDPWQFFRDLIGEYFVLSVIGQCYSEIPTEFLEAKEILKDKIVNWGFLESREKYRTQVKNT